MREFIANRPLFPRNSYLIINNIKINDQNNHGLKFDVSAKSGAEGEVGQASIKIYNLSQKIELGSEVELWFGYADDVGYYSKYEVIGNRKTKEKGTVIQTLICSERTKNSSKIISLSLDGNIKSSQAIKEIAKKMGLNLVKLELKKDKTYTNGYTCYNQGFQELKALVEDTESKMTLKSDDLYIYTDNQKTYSVRLSFDSGLLHNPREIEEQELENKINNKYDNENKENWSEEAKKATVKSSNKYDYIVETLPIHYLKKGDLIYVESLELSAYVQIEELELELADTWKMKLGVKVVNNG